MVSGGADRIEYFYFALLLLRSHSIVVFRIFKDAFFAILSHYVVHENRRFFALGL